MSDNFKKTLSIIIVTYQKIDIVRDCLDSIKKYNDIGEALEVIISDNSEDDTLYNVIKKEYDWIQIIKNKNEGFGAGNNRGFDISSGKYLLFLNPDTILVEPIFKFAIEQFEKKSDLALFGIQLLKPNLKRNYSFYIMDKYGILALLQSKFAFLFNYYKDGKMFIAGADLFVRRESFEKAGRFDEKIFMYKEEADLIKRIKLDAVEKTTCFFKHKSMIHLEGGTEDISIDRRTVIAERIVLADRYYCNKYNIKLNTVLKQRIRRARLKLCIFQLIGKKNHVMMEKKLIQIYKDALEK